MGAYRFLIPVGLGLVAGVLNYLVISGATAPIEIAVVTQDVSPGTKLTENMLGKIQIRADAKLLRNAIQYQDRGILYGQAVQRRLVADDIVFRIDIENDTNGMSSKPFPGERSCTLDVLDSSITPGLQPEDRVILRVDPRLSAATASESAPNWVGPYRLLHISRPKNEREARRVVVAVPERDWLNSPLQKALRPSDISRVEREGAGGSKVAGR